MKNKIAFVLDHKLHHYRSPLFTALGEYYNVTVFHRGPKVVAASDFKQNIVTFKNIGPFELIKGLHGLTDYDAVIIMQNLRVLNLYTMPIIMRKKTRLMWGIGTSSSKGLGSESGLSMALRNIATLMYQGLALYSSIPVANYWSKNKAKVSIVGNSILNEEALNTSDQKKEYFLFIGSLNKRKGLNELLNAFEKAVSVHASLQLKIIGDGPERNAIEQEVSVLGLSSNVQLLGAIHDSAVKKEIFSKALCIISPLQAGLSVVEAFSYGVPFVTSSTSITGGESQSIIHESNGILFNNINELPDIVCSFVDGRRDSSFLGNNGYNFYQEHLAFKLYVQRFKKFIDQHL